MRCFSMGMLAVSVLLGAEALPASEGGGTTALRHPGYGATVARYWQQDNAATKTSSRVPKALLFSALVPGTGQLYNHSYLKAGIFAVIEVASWYAYFNQNNKGKRLEDDFQAFANAHWNEDRYWNALAAESGYDPDDKDSLREYERTRFSHFLPDTKNQTYYENIGKYDQFNVGWDDATLPHGRDSALRQDYTYMRKASNDAYGWARTAASALLANHVLSAVEAAYTAHKQGSRMAASFKVQPLYNGHEYVPALAMRVRW